MYYRIIGSLLICCLLVSCTSFKSKHIAGKVIDFKKKEIGKESIWKVGKKVFYIKIYSKNEAKLAHLEWNKEKKEFVAVNQNILRTKLGDYFFLNVQDNDGYYTIVRCAATSEDSIVIYTVEEKKVKADIKAGKLNATIEKHDIIFNGTKEELDNYLKENSDRIFDPSAPGVAHKIKTAK